MTRPYQLLCLICSLGERRGPKDLALKKLAERIRRNPDLPLTLVCNAGDVYAFQDPGVAGDTPEGRDFNRKRDLDLLQRMGWPPGVTLPARTALKMIHQQIPSVAGLCGYAHATSAAWKGCPRALSGAYEKGHQAEDNLPELLDLILHANPEVRIKMARQADWMMCAPCPNRAPKLNACVNVLGSGGLSNEKRDLDLLQILGLEFGSTMKARDLLLRLFARIPSTQAVCARDNVRPSVWWDGCGEYNLKKGKVSYAKGRRALMKM